MNSICNTDTFSLEWLTNTADNRWNFTCLSSLYKDYLNELSQYGTVLSEEALPAPEENTSVNYVAIWNKDKTELIGFILYSLPPDSFASNDIYIGELYIRPNFRRQGIAEQAIDLLVHVTGSQELDMSMFILDDNAPAHAFWQQYFAKHNFTNRFQEGNVTACATGHTDIKMYYWRKVPANA